MPIRKKDSGLALLRRSSDDQPNSLQVQAEWAIAAAKREGVKLSGDLTDVEDALRDRKIKSKGFRLDISVTGADLNRPGLQAFVDDAIRDQSISHVFIHKRDRFARPDDPIDAVLIERRLTDAGITIVFSDRNIPPSSSGAVDLGERIMSLVDYHQSGQFLKLHAERVLLTQRRLAERGLWTGGRPPYGFTRALLKPNGDVDVLESGKRVRQAGCHVIIMPHDWAKIIVWIRILDMADDGWKPKRIAALLTKEGIPSPGAGQTRRDHGIKHQVSGVWHPNTVKSLIENRAILGVLEYGRRSEGRHRRLSRDGTRELCDEDRREDRSTKTIRNDPSLVISANLRSGANYDRDKWDSIQEKRKQHTCNQRGVPRSRDLGRYPMSCRSIDLTDGCGHPMYGRPHDNRSILVCGRYMKSNGQDCHNNSVDAEAVLAFVLRTLRQLVVVNGGRAAIERKLQRAAAENSCLPAVETQEKAIATLEQSLKGHEACIATATRRLATVSDDLVPDVENALRVLKEEARMTQQRLADERKRALALPADPEREVQAAMAMLDQLDSTISHPEARRELTLLFVRLNLWLGLEFAEGIKGKTRKVRKLVGGVLTFDERNLPVPPYGKDRVHDCTAPTNCLPVGREGTSSPSEKPARGGREINNKTAHIGVGGDLENRREDVSFTKENRGDWIRTSDLLLPKQAL